MSRLAIGLAAACLATAWADAATVFLRDGGRLQGTILSSTAQGIELKTSSDVTVRIAADRIDHIDYSEAAPAAEPVPYSPAPERPARRVWRVREPSLAEAPHELSLDLGVSAPLSDVDFSNVCFTGVGCGGRDRNGDPGVLAGLRYLYYPDPRWGWGFDFHYLGRSWTSTQSLTPGAETNVSGGSEVFLAALKYRIVPDGPVRPYLLGGVGAHRTTLAIDSTPLPGFAWGDTGTFETRRLVDGEAWGFATSARFGVDFPSFSPTFVGFELGWTGLFHGRYNPTQAGANAGLGTFSGPLNIFTIAGHIGWRF